LNEPKAIGRREGGYALTQSGGATHTGRKRNVIRRSEKNHVEIGEHCDDLTGKHAKNREGGNTDSRSKSKRTNIEKEDPPKRETLHTSGFYGWKIEGMSAIRLKSEVIGEKKKKGGDELYIAVGERNKLVQDKTREKLCLPKGEGLTRKTKGSFPIRRKKGHFGLVKVGINDHKAS